jgi:MATE family multidrug resistance protein
MLGSFTPSLADLRALIRLAVPIVAVQVGIMLLGVVGTIYVGHVSAQALASVALGNLYLYGLFTFGMGTLWAVDPIVTQALGARDHDGASLGVQRGLVLAVVLGVLLTLACLPAEAVLRLLREPPELVPEAARFVRLTAPSMLPSLLFVPLRQTLQAMHRPRAIVFAIVACNVVNLAMNELFVRGRFGMPAMGSMGAALAITAARYTQFGALVLFAGPRLKPFMRPWRQAAFAVDPLLRTLRIGLPIGAQSSVEFTTFAMISIFAGWFGANAIGGHQVAINLASLMYMVPLGVGSAAAVLAGRAIGAGDMPHARRVAASALLCGPGFMVFSAGLLFVFAHQLASVWTSVPEVVRVAAALIPIASVFQVFDGVQVVSAGILRGAGDTRAPLLANLTGFWLMGMPVSLVLGFRAHLGIVGLWWGFVAGLGGVALVLLFRVRHVLSRPVGRIRVEAPPA